MLLLSADFFFSKIKFFENSLRNTIRVSTSLDTEGPTFCPSSPDLGQSCLQRLSADNKQGSHRLEKYLNIQGCLEKSLKIKFALKSTWKTLKTLEKSLNFTLYRRIQHWLLRPTVNQFKIVVPLFGAVLLHQIKAPQFYTNFLKLISFIMQSTISKV